MECVEDIEELIFDKEIKIHREFLFKTTVFFIEKYNLYSKVNLRMNFFAVEFIEERVAISVRAEVRRSKSWK